MNNYNPRLLFRGASMDELTKSIKEFGLLEPLVVRQLKNGKYEVVCGARRYHALKTLKAKDVECNVVELSDAQARLVSLVENIQRENLTKMEEARAYAINLGIDFSNFLNLKSFFNNTKNKKTSIPKFAKKIGKSTTTVYLRLYLLFLSKNIKDALENEQLKFPLGYAQEIPKLRQLITVEKDDKGKTVGVKNVDLAHRFMDNIYDEWFHKPEAVNLQYIAERVESQLEKYQAKVTQSTEDLKATIKAIEQNIVDAKATRDQIKKPFDDAISDFYVEFPKADIKKSLGENEVMENGEEWELEPINILEFLKTEAKRYSNDAEYEATRDRIENLENRITDSYNLIERAKNENIRVCPYCHALISIEIVERDLENLREELAVVKKEKERMMGIENTIADLRKTINKYYDGLKAKDGLITQKKAELHTVNQELEKVKNSGN